MGGGGGAGGGEGHAAKKNIPVLPGNRNPYSTVLTLLISTHIRTYVLRLCVEYLKRLLKNSLICSQPN
jgi:hypothetical protein